MGYMYLYVAGIIIYITINTTALCGQGGTRPGDRQASDIFTWGECRATGIVMAMGT